MLLKENDDACKHGDRMNIELAKKRLEIAYSLIPPPLSSLPAKYWTSMSILAHSYNVGRMTEELIKLVNENKKPVIEADISFLIGFVHDLGQKRWIEKNNLEKTINYVIFKLEDLGYDRSTAKFISKTILTNVAETERDPLLYDIAPIIRFSDLVHGSENITDIIINLKYLEKETNISYKIYSATISQTFVRSWIGQKIRERLEKEVGNVVLITTTYGIIAISTDRLPDIVLDWDNDFRYLVEGEPLASEEIIKAIESMSLYKEKTETGLEQKDVIKLYFGSIEEKEKIYGEIILPDGVQNMLTNISISGVIYRSGKYICPVCGMNHPQGMNIAVLKYLYGKVAKEKWSRRYPPVNLHQYLGRSSKYLACPLCLMDALLFYELVNNLINQRTDEDKVFFSVSFKAPMLLNVLEELSSVMNTLLSEISSTNPLERLNYSRYINNENIYTGQIPLFDAFSSTIYSLYKAYGISLDFTLRILSIAGTLLSWGLYPLKVDIFPSTIPTETLLTTFIGERPIYNYQPRHDRERKITPYVSSLLMTIEELQKRNETLPMRHEILNYEPKYAPLLLLYAFPKLYKIIENQRKEVEG